MNIRDLGNTLFVIGIEREEVEAKDLSRIKELLKKIRGKHGKNSLEITFSGYDDLTDEIFEIEAIRAWVDKLFKEYPYILYYIEDRMDGWKNLIACYCDVEAAIKTGELKNSLQVAKDLIEHGIQPQTFPVIVKIDDTRRRTITQSMLTHGKAIQDTEGAKQLVKSFNEIFPPNKRF